MEKARNVLSMPRFHRCMFEKRSAPITAVDLRGFFVGLPDENGGRRLFVHLFGWP